jgi:pSer/pThr/pTyr-binding forkhead associated (FHA) protein
MHDPVLAEPQLVGVTGDQLAGQVYPLRAGDQIVGRGGAADITVDCADVSRVHAYINWDGQTVTVVDAGSRNGTAVNGHQLEGRCALRPGDVIRLGSAEFRLEASLAPSHETSTTSFGKRRNLMRGTATIRPRRCLPKGSLRRLVAHDLAQHTRSLMLGLLGVPLVVVGMLLADAKVGIPLMLLGVGVFVFSVVLPITSRAELGTTGFKFTLAKEQRTKDLEPLLTGGESDQLRRVALLLSADPTNVASFVNDAITATYRDLPRLAPHDRESHALCELVARIRNGLALGLLAPVQTPEISDGATAELRQAIRLQRMGFDERAAAVLSLVYPDDDALVCHMIGRDLTDYHALLHEAEQLRLTGNTGVDWYT